MGIQDRDYMKKRPSGGGGQSEPLDQKLEAFLGGFLARHPRFFLYLGIGFGILFVVAVIGAKLK